jgi:hypothetical protein
LGKFWVSGELSVTERYFMEDGRSYTGTQKKKKKSKERRLILLSDVERMLPNVALRDTQVWILGQSKNLMTSTGWSCKEEDFSGSRSLEDY